MIKGNCLRVEVQWYRMNIKANFFDSMHECTDSFVLLIWILKCGN